MQPSWQAALHLCISVSRFQPGIDNPLKPHQGQLCTPPCNPLRFFCKTLLQRPLAEPLARFIPPAQPTLTRSTADDSTRAAQPPRLSRQPAPPPPSSRVTLCQLQGLQLPLQLLLHQNPPPLLLPGRALSERLFEDAPLPARLPRTLQDPVSHAATSQQHLSGNSKTSSHVTLPV